MALRPEPELLSSLGARLRWKRRGRLVSRLSGSERAGRGAPGCPLAQAGLQYQTPATRSEASPSAAQQRGHEPEYGRYSAAAMAAAGYGAGTATARRAGASEGGR